MTYIKGDASVFVAVNVPATTDRVYRSHAKRIVKVLNQYGYEAYAMSHEYILKLAVDIERQVAAAQEAEQLVAHAIENRKDDD